MKISISIVIITFNEEKNIGRCLSSLKNLSDDIVVVDSFSTDSTEAICKEFGVRFVQHEFEGHIEQKNWAITQAKYPHILSLDADEVVSDELYNSIKSVLSNWKSSGYTMNRLTNYCGHWVKHCGWYPDTKLRLWDSRLGKWGGDNPHDKYEMYSKHSEIEHLKGDILHYSYYTLDDHYKQVAYFTDILAKAQFKKGKMAPIIMLVFSPIVKFIKDYFIKLGFLDGKVGFRICRISAYATFTKYKKLRFLYKNNIN
jgi:glycosyltransferase involved in cell wall biosynthesis